MGWLPAELINTQFNEECCLKPGHECGQRGQDESMHGNAGKAT